MKLNIYTQIKLNLIPLLVALVLITIELFLFVLSNESSLTLKEIPSDTKYLQNSYAVFNWKVNSTVSNLQFK